MGSWNHTCMLSNLHIFSGEPVVSLFMTERKGAMIDNLCYSNSFWDPIPIILYGDYNDYGAVENFTGQFDDVLIDIIGENLVEMELGENEYHDIAVKKDMLTSEFLYEADHEARLFVRPYRMYTGEDTGPRLVRHAVIKRSLFDRILSDLFYDEYVGGDRSYDRHTFGSMTQDMDANTKWLFDKVKSKSHLVGAMAGLEDDDGDAFMPSPRATRAYDMFLEDIWHTEGRKTGAPSFVQWLGRRDVFALETYWYSRFAEMEFERAKAFLEERLKFAWLNYFVSLTRHHWTPMTGAGSQSCSLEGYDLLGRYVVDEVEREREERFGEDD